MVDRREQILDELLVLRCQEGSREAYRRLVERWQGRLWRHALRLTGRDDAAWDVVQETWMAVTKSIDRLADPGTFRRWIYTIATRKAADWQRRRGRDEQAVDMPAEQLPDSAAPAKSRSAIALLREALNHLPGERQAILCLRYIEGFEVHELAEILGVAEGTMKSRLFHARKHLREIMERIDR